MALVSIPAQNASLDNDYGATKGPNAAAAHEVALYAGDPLTGGVELDSAGGYARPVVSNDGTTWAAADGGAKTSAVVTWDVSTAEWTSAGDPAVADYFLLIDSATGDFWDSGLLSDPISVDAAGATPSAVLTVFYDNEGA
jgi:hypothetical protein